MANPTSVRPMGKVASGLRRMVKQRLKISDIVDLALEEVLKKYPTSDEMRSAIIAKKSAEYGV